MTTAKQKYEVGKVRGRLTLLEKTGDVWKCQCSCGNQPMFCESVLPEVRSCGCVVILGLDLATNSGWAVRYSWRSVAGIKCGTFNVKENDSGEECSPETKYALVANAVHKLMVEHRPDFVVFEQPQRNVKQFKKRQVNPVTGKSEEVATINPGALQLTGVAGAAVGVCMLMQIPCGYIASISWHSKYHGKGVVPAAGEDWKDVAIHTCELEGVELPRTKKDKKDAAEAACISGCWHWSNVLEIKWMRERFMALRTNAAKVKQARNERVAA